MYKIRVTINELTSKTQFSTYKIYKFIEPSIFHSFTVFITFSFSTLSLEVYFRDVA